MSKINDELSCRRLRFGQSLRFIWLSEAAARSARHKERRPLVTQTHPHVDRASMVHEVEMQRGGETHVATYYIEYGMIHACLEGKTTTVPHGAMPAADTVRVLLASTLLYRARRAGQRRTWAGIGGGRQ